MNRVLGRNVFCLNPHDNGGESLIFETEFIDNGGFNSGENPGYFTNQIITLSSYGNSASINIGSSTITPATLRKLADEIELEINKLKLLKPFSQ